MPRHRDIIAWQRAMDLTVATCSLNGPRRSLGHTDLASQLMRASVSIPSNTAEGNGREAPGEFADFLDVAMGSLREVETLLQLTDLLGLVKRAMIAELQRQSDETGRLLYEIRRSKRAQ